MSHNDVNKQDISMAELLCTKLCHDITGPVGAVSNGAEFLEGADGTEIMDQAVDLIRSSARQAVIRIQMFRLCYGVVKGDGNSDIEQMRSIAADYFSANKITLWWDIADNIVLPRSWGRVLLNVMLMSSEILLRGGVMKIACKNDADGVLLSVNVSGDKMKDTGEIKSVICGGESVVDTKNVQHHFTKSIINGLGGAVECLGSESEFTIKVKSCNG